MKKLSVTRKINEIKANVPYYQSNPTYQGEYEQFPIISKDDVLADRQQFICNINLEFEQYITRTSGSSGKILEIIWNYSDYCYATTKLWKRRLEHGVKYNDYFARSYVNYYEDNQVLNYKLIVQNNELLMSKLYLDNKSLDLYIDYLIKCNVSWMLLQPSFAYALAQRVFATNRTISNLKFIELTGELLSDEIKNSISKLFNVPVYNLYGMEEFGVIAYDDDNGELELWNENCIVEILNENNVKCDDRVEGYITVTTLINKRMPLLRYKTGDKGYIYKNNGVSYIKVIRARSNDSIILNGIEYDGSLFFNLVELLNTLGYSIIDFQFSLEDNNLFCNFFDAGLDLSVKDLINRYFKVNYSHQFDQILIIADHEKIQSQEANKIKYFINKNK